MHSIPSVFVHLLLQEMYNVYDDHFVFKNVCHFYVSLLRQTLEFILLSSILSFLLYLFIAHYFAPFPTFQCIHLFSILILCLVYFDFCCLLLTIFLLYRGLSNFQVMTFWWDITIKKVKEYGYFGHHQDLPCALSVS